MVRTVPSVGLMNPDVLIASGAVWNSGPKAMGDFYVSPPTFRGRSTVTISTTSGTWTAMPLQTTDIDTDSGHSNVTNNTRYTCQVAGWYWVEGFAAWTNTTATQCPMDCAVYKNGSVVFGSQQTVTKTVNDFGSVSSATTVLLAVGDYVEIFGRQSGGTINTQTGGTDLQPAMNVFWLHA